MKSHKYCPNCGRHLTNPASPAWLDELQRLTENYATPDIKSDYLSLTVDEKWGLYLWLSRHER